MTAMDGTKRTDQEKIDTVRKFLANHDDKHAMIEFGLLTENLELEGRELYTKFQAFKKAAGY